MEYRVRWEIDIEAATIEEACAKALCIQRDPNSLATFFTVYSSDESRGASMGVSEEALKKVKEKLL